MTVACGSHVHLTCCDGLDNVHRLCAAMSLSLTAAWLDHQHSMSQHVHP